VQLPSAPGVPEVMGPLDAEELLQEHLDLRLLHDIIIDIFLSDFF